MNDLNPLLKHKKIGQALGWDDLQNPTKEGFRDALNKASNFAQKRTIAMTIFGTISAHPIYTSEFLLAKIMGVLILGMSIYIVFDFFRRKSEFTSITDEEIDEQLAVYREWNK
ncbi:MAG: hypothetical protein ISR82_02155 [Candidatus Marinimicrobia bacterium]|nr:hypothetical protein [Candidatus Neomarinimicrobiota bacterium]MBL7010010.1 hypothetical protein [Candidatus Neomarinimicrobiota bacterium]MBL7029720.1 hypothetical protein [Candidatus Neomarinimicrobiota bacterium]